MLCFLACISTAALHRPQPQPEPEIRGEAEALRGHATSAHATELEAQARAHRQPWATCIRSWQQLNSELTLKQASLLPRVVQLVGRTLSRSAWCLASQR